MRALPMTVLLLAGCPGEDENATAEMSHCEETVTDLDIDEVSRLGFSGADLVAIAAGGWSEELTWAEGGLTALSMDVAGVGATARFVDLEPDERDGEVQTDVEVICDDFVEVDVSFRFVTADGAFDEAWTGALRSTDGVEALLAVAFNDEELAGTYRFDRMDPSEYDEKVHSLLASFGSEGSAGTIEAQASATEDCDHGDCVAWARNFEVGSWGGGAY